MPLSELHCSLRQQNLKTLEIKTQQLHLNLPEQRDLITACSKSAWQDIPSNRRQTMKKHLHFKVFTSFQKSILKPQVSVYISVVQLACPCFWFI